MYEIEDILHFLLWAMRNCWFYDTFMKFLSFVIFLRNIFFCLSSTTIKKCVKFMKICIKIKIQKMCVFVSFSWNKSARKQCDNAVSFCCSLSKEEFSIIPTFRNAKHKKNNNNERNNNEKSIDRSLNFIALWRYALEEI